MRQTAVTTLLVSARVAAWAIAGLILCPASLLAQEQTGSLYGKVTDSSGLAIPGATVTITSPQLIRPDVRLTDGTGSYRARLLPPGVYSVSAELQGFAVASRSGVTLATGAALGVDLVLSPEGVQESVVVAAEVPLVDVKNSQNTRTLDNNTLQTMPVGRNFHELIKTVSGVVDGEYNFAPVQAVHGSSVRDNVYTVDGAGANDSTVGYMTTEIPYDMIEEVQVTTGGATAQFSQGGAAVFSFVTKSGGNDFSGGISFFGEGGGLSGDNITEELRQQGISGSSKMIKNLEYGAFVGGPIKRDRLWFFGNVRWLDTEQGQPDFPANKLYDQRQTFLKLTGQAGRLRVHGSFTEGLFREFVDQGDFTIAASPENWRDQHRHQQILAFGANYTIRQDTYLELRASRSFKGFEPEFPFNPEQVSGFIDVGTGLHSGGHTRPDRLRKKMDQGQVSLTLSHFKSDFLGGSHDFKVGTLYEMDPYEQQETLYNGNDLIRLLQNGRPYRVQLFNTPVGKTATNVTIQSAFLQDQWSIKDRVTLNLGARYESSEGWTPDQEYGGGRWVARTMVPEERDLINLTTVSPRVGLVWALGGSKRTSLRMSYGRYFSPLLVGNVPNPIGSASRELDWNDLNGDRQFQEGEAGTLRRNFPTFTRPPQDPNLKSPYTDGFNIGFDHQLGANVGISVSGIVKRERDISETVDVGRPFSAYRPLSVVNPLDGQPMTIYALDPAFQSVPSTIMRTNPKSPVPLYRDYDGIEVVLTKRMSNRWHALASLNLGRSKGNVGTSFGYSAGTSALYNNPNTLINVDGPLDLDSPLQVKVAGGWEAPHGVMLSVYYAGTSGIPIHPPENFPDDPALGAYTVRFNRTDNPAIVAESFIAVAGVQRGTYRQDFRHNLSFRLEKQLKIRSTRLALTADAFNLLNISTVTAVQTMKVWLPNFLAPARIVPPRGLRLGARFEF